MPHISSIDLDFAFSCFPPQVFSENKDWRSSESKLSLKYEKLVVGFAHHLDYFFVVARF